MGVEQARRDACGADSACGADKSLRRSVASAAAVSPSAAAAPSFVIVCGLCLLSAAIVSCVMPLRLKVSGLGFIRVGESRGGGGDSAVAAQRIRIDISATQRSSSSRRALVLASTPFPQSQSSSALCGGGRRMIWSEVPVTTRKFRRKRIATRALAVASLMAARKSRWDSGPPSAADPTTTAIPPAVEYAATCVARMGAGYEATP